MPIDLYGGITAVKPPAPVGPRDARAFEVTGDDPREKQAAPGAYKFMYSADGQRKIGIIHACPCGCGGRSAMWFEGMGQYHAGGPEWKVTGEWPNVTLSPSIGIGRKPEGGYHWHGYLENGVFVER